MNDDLEHHLDLSLLLQVLSIIWVSFRHRFIRSASAGQLEASACCSRCANCINICIHLSPWRKNGKLRLGTVGVFTIFLSSLLFPFAVILVASFAYSLQLETLIMNLGPFLIPSLTSGVLLSLACKDRAKNTSFWMRPNTGQWKPWIDQSNAFDWMISPENAKSSSRSCLIHGLGGHR